MTGGLDDQEAVEVDDASETQLPPLEIDVDKANGSIELLSPLKSPKGSTKSLSDSVFEERIENGRRYANGTYFLPNDDTEETRLAITHQAYLLILNGKLALGRIRDDIGRVLDLGTGLGEWAVTFGENYPDAEVIATDISASQPIDVPPNVDFQIDDINSDWTYTDPFDFIHMRGLSGASFDWPKIYAQAYQHLEKDGQIEIADWGPIKLDNQPKDSYLSIYNAALQSAMEKAGTGIWLEHLKKPLLESAGFSILKSMTIEVPLGTWSRDRRKIGLGKMAMISALEGLEANSLRLLTKELGWKPEEVQDLCMKVKQELLSPGAKASLPCQFIIARKLFTP